MADKDFVVRKGLSVLNGAIEGSNGSASAPAFTFGSDTNTGFYRDGSDVIGIALGGSRKFRIYNDTFRLDGTTNPQVIKADDASVDLQLQGGSAGAGLIRIGRNNQNITLTPAGTGVLNLDGLLWPSSDGTANYVLKTDGSAQLSWTEMSSGGVSVGTHAGNNNIAYFSDTGEISNNNNISVSAVAGSADFFGSVEAGNVKIGTDTYKNTIETTNTNDLVLRTNAGTNSGTITIEDGADGDIDLIPNGTGSVNVNYTASTNTFALQVAGNANNYTAFHAITKSTTTNAIQTAAALATGISSGTRTTGFGTQLEFRIGELNYGGYLAGKIGAKMQDTGNANFDMFITPSGTGNLALGNFTLNADQSVGSGQDNYVMTYDHSAGTVGLEAASSSGATAIDGLSDAITTATSNIGLGSGALDSVSASNGNYNTALGINAATTVSTGDMNVAIGYAAAQYLTEGGSNIAIGKSALERASTENSNIAIGGQAMGGAYGQTATGSYNIAIGADAARYGFQANGGSNVAIGRKAMHGSNGNSSAATYNVAVGRESLEAITTGDYNIGVGYKSLEAITTGTRNIAIGTQALDAADTESDNIAIGYDALGGAVDGGEFNIAIGNYSMDAILTGDSSVAIGHYAGSAMTSAHSSVFIGANAGQAMTTGVRNVAIGFEALKTATTGSDNNVAIGEDALTLLSTDSDSNVAIGRRSGYRVTTGSTDNVFIGGYETGGNIATGDTNVLIGSYAGQNLNAASSANVLIGYGAGNGASTNAANKNHAIGYDSLGALTTGDKNIAIGYQSGNNVTSGDGNVIIGNADVASATGNDQLSISSGDGTPVWITGDSSGNVKLPDGNLDMVDNYITTSTSNGYVKFKENGTAGFIFYNDDESEYLRIQSGGHFQFSLESAGAESEEEAIMQFRDAAGTMRNFMSINSDDLVIHNRAANGKVIIQANTSSAGANDVTAATFEDDKVTFAVQPVLPSAGIKFSDGSQQTVAASAGGTSFLDGAELIDLPDGIYLEKLLPYGTGRQAFGNPFTTYVQYFPFLAPASGNVSKLGMRTNSYADDVDIQIGIYTDVNGTPTALMGRVEISIDSDASHTSTQFSSTITLVKGVQYWCGYMVDDSTVANSFYGANSENHPIVYSGQTSGTHSHRKNVRSDNNATQLPSTPSGVNGYWTTIIPQIYCEI